MADDSAPQGDTVTPPPQQQQGPGGATSAPSSASGTQQDTTGLPSEAERERIRSMSFEQYKAMYDSANTADTTTGPTKPPAKAPAPEPHPVMSFLKGWVDANVNAAKQIAGSTIVQHPLQGIEDLTNSLFRGVIETGTGAGQLVNEAFEGRQKAEQGAKQTQAVIDKYLPQNEDDKLAGFTEAATTFATGWAITGELKLFKGAQKLAEIAENPATSRITKAILTAARGGVVDASAFNPAQASIAELAAKSPIPIVKPIGELLSVKGDDSGIVARLKRATAGMIPAAAMEGIISAARLVRSGKALAEGATGSERDAAEATIKESASTLQNVADGTHATPEQHTIAVPNGDGTASLQVNPSSKAGKAIESNPNIPPANGVETPKGITYSFSGYRGVQAGRSLNEPGHGGAIFLSANRETAEKFRSGIHGDQEPGALGQATVELNNPKIVTTYGEAAEPGETKPQMIERLRKEGYDGILVKSGHDNGPEVAALHPDRVNFETLPAAQMQAETVNHAIDGVSEPTNVTAEQAAAYRETAKALASSNSPEDIQRLMDGTHFNLRYMNGSDALRAHVEALSDHFADVLDEAKKSGGVTVEDSFKMAHDMIGHFSEANATKALSERIGQRAALSVSSLANDMHLKDLGQKLAQMSDVLESRPTDVVAQESARRMLGTYLDFAKDVAGDESEVGRALNLKKYRDRPEMDNPQYAEEGQAAAKDRTAQPQRTANTKPSDLVAKPAAITEGKAAVQEAKAEVAKAKKALVNKTDTESVNATQFSLARVQKRLENAMKGLPERVTDRPTRIMHAEDIAAQEEKFRAENPGATLPDALQMAKDAQGAKAPSNPIEDLSRQIDAAEKRLQAETERAANPKGKSVGGSVTPFDRLKANANAKPSDLVAGMPTRDLRASLRIIKMAGGEPRNTEAVVKSIGVMKKNPTIGGKIFEFFANSLLSGPKTSITIAGTNATLSNFEPVVRMVAGALTGNKAMIQEGSDIMWGNWKYVGDNLQSARATLNSGQSLIDPMPSRNQIGGVTGDIVRTPGKVIGAIDEFTTTSNYRSRIRAASLRQGRAQGLTGDALNQRVDDDLRAAFDENGIARVPSALDASRKVSLLSPLRDNQFGKGLQNWTQNSLAMRFLDPFVRFGANMFDYVWQATPGVNYFNQQARSIMQAGGEEAAVLHTRSLLAGSAYVYGIMSALNGNLTGRGPSDPKLREMWLKDHQPYSIKVGNQTISYHRAEPLSLPLGLMADMTTAIQELDHKRGSPLDTDNLGYAIVASLTSNFANESYLSGMTNFMAAWSQDDPHATAKWIQNFGASLAVPQIVRTFNNDDTMRETRGFADAIINQIPGWSKTLDPRYNAFGEKVMRQTGYAQKAINPYPVMPVTEHPVEDALLKLGRGLPNPEQKLGVNKDIDLTSSKWIEKKGQPTPWNRFNELLRDGTDGEGGLRAKLTDLVKSDEWKESSPGTEMFPGGERFARAAAVQTEAWERAKKQLMEEYPKLKTAIEFEQRLKAGAFMSGSAGVQQVQAQFGGGQQQ